jgi:uncharacterized membrane protein YhaH (DUF805 family)
MIIVLALAALASSALCLVLLWPYGPVLAFVATPFVASLAVVLAGLAIAATRPRDSGRSSNQLIDALSRLLPR